MSAKGAPSVAQAGAPAAAEQNAAEAPSRPAFNLSEIHERLVTLSEFAFAPEANAEPQWSSRASASFVLLTCGAFWLAVAAVAFYVW